jgi:hypothetical protein
VFFISESKLIADFNFRVETDFEFTALDISIIVANSLTPTLRQFSGVQSRVVPSWVTRAPTPDATLMEIVDLGVVSTKTASWGNLKARYRGLLGRASTQATPSQLAMVSAPSPATHSTPVRGSSCRG